MPAKTNLSPVNAGLFDNPLLVARLAGVFYLVIIILGIWSEVAVRGTLIVSEDAAATASNILQTEGLYRLSFVADLLMALSDAVLAVLLYLLLSRVEPVLALMAMVFRLLQTAIIGMNLLNMQASLLILKKGAQEEGLNEESAALLSSFWTELQSQGYDLGLVFFGVNCLITGYLIFRSGFIPGFIGILVSAAGVIYLSGSGVRFLAPDLTEAFELAYIIPLVAETAFCLWLLIRGVSPTATTQ